MDEMADQIEDLTRGSLRLLWEVFSAKGEAYRDAFIGPDDSILPDPTRVVEWQLDFDMACDLNRAVRSLAQCYRECCELRRERTAKG